MTVSKKFPTTTSLVAAVMLVLISLSTATATTLLQDPLSSEPLIKDTAKAQDPVESADPSAPQTKQTANDKSGKKPEKRGSFIVAPIPISSPAFGSGFLFYAGYVFKLDMNDNLSPPSAIGMAGAFTNNGTRGGALGGRLYFKENRYQTTFAVAKGRAKLDFFGIGRIPGRPPISVPLKIDGTIFFGEVMRNVGQRIFVGARYQYRRLGVAIEGIRPPGGFELPQIDIRSTS